MQCAKTDSQGFKIAVAEDFWKRLNVGPLGFHKRLEDEYAPMA
jgi:hypothetical protein